MTIRYQKILTAMYSLLYFLILFLFESVSTSYPDTIEERLAKVENELSTHKESYLKLQEVNLKLERELSTHKKAAVILEKKVDDQAKAIEQLHKPCSKGNNVTSRAINAELSGGTVAFSAFLDKDAHNLNLNQAVPFNNILTNIGGGYHNSTYIFTCPVSGVYLFSFSIAEFTAQEICAMLVIDGQNVVDAIADPYHDNQDIQAMNVAILQLSLIHNISYVCIIQMRYQLKWYLQSQNQ